MIQHDRIMIYGPDHGCCGTASPCGAGNVLRRRIAAAEAERDDQESC